MSETVFKQVNYTLGDLVSYVELGEVGLPDIQRPFIWKNAKVRDLFDSMYRGYPVGYMLLWQNAYEEDSKAIGTDGKQKPPRLLIVDGQQRLTSLYAVVRGIPVVRDNYDAEAIEIAFNPLQEKFEVADAAVRRDKSYIPNISRVWSKESDLFDLLDDYMEGLESSREVQACLRPRDRFLDIPAPKIDSAFDNLLVPQPSWSPSTAQQLRKLVAAPYLSPNDWTPRSEAYFVFPLAQGTPGKQCGLAATGDYQPSLRSPWLAAIDSGQEAA